MRFYKIYSLDRADRIRDVFLVEAETDEQALSSATEARRRNCAVEVWDRIRFVGRIEAGDTPDRSSSHPDAAFVVTAHTECGATAS